MSRLPPYGIILRERLADRANWPRWAGTSPDGNHVSIWIACGPGAWQWARAHIDHRLLLVAPLGEDPARYNWRMLRGHDPVTLLSCGAITADDVLAVVRAMMACGVDRVMHGGAHKITRYRRATPEERINAA